MGANRSTAVGQQSGIKQGCPLSPFRIILVLSAIVIIIEDIMTDDIASCVVGPVEASAMHDGARQRWARE